MRGGTKQGGPITGHDCVWLDQWNTQIYVRDKLIKGIEVNVKILIPLDTRKFLKYVKIGRISRYRMKNTKQKVRRLTAYFQEILVMFTLTPMQSP